MADQIQISNDANNNNNIINNADTIEKENNCKIIEQIINLKLKSFFNYLKSILKKRDNISKAQFFTILKSIQQNSDYNNSINQNEINKTLISQIIYHKLNNSTKNIFYIYKYYILRKKIKYFEFWKRYISLCKNLENEFNAKNSYNKKLNDLKKQIKNMNMKIDNLKKDEKKVNKSVQIKEEQKNNAQKNIKALSNKCKQLQKEKDNIKNINSNIINMKNTNNNRNNVNITTNSTKNKETEEKKMELESNLRQVKEEDSNNDKKFKNFINIIDNKLNDYQLKAQDIIRQKNQRSLEISKADFEKNNEQIMNKITDICTSSGK